MPRHLYIIISTFLLIFSVTSEEIKVAVAANLTYPIKELKKLYEKENPGTKIQIALGSSGKLSAQIIHGAEFDLFLAANELYPLKLNRLGLISGKPQPYCLGKLILFSAGHIDVSKGVESLKSKKLQHLAIANPKLAPYGIAAIEVLDSKSLHKTLKKKLVVGENVAQSVQFGLTAAEAAFIPMSALHTPAMKEIVKEKGNIYEIPEDLYNPIIQAATILRNGNNQVGAQKFLNFILSDKGQKLLEEFGYKKASCKCVKKLTCPKCIKL